MIHLEVQIPHTGDYLLEDGTPDIESFCGDLESEIAHMLDVGNVPMDGSAEAQADIHAYDAVSVTQRG